MSTEFFRKYIDIVDESVVDEAARGMIYNPGGAGTSRRPNSPEERDLIAKGLKTARSYNQDVAKYNAAQAPNQIPRAPEEAPPAPPEKIRGARSGMIRVPDMDSDGTGTTKLAGMPLKHDRDQNWVSPDRRPPPRQTTAIDTTKISADSRAQIRGDIRANQGKATEPKLGSVTVPKKPERPW